MCISNKKLNDCLKGVAAGNKKWAGYLYKVLVKCFITLVVSSIRACDVKDVLHDAYIKIIKCADKYEPDTNAVGWVVRVVKNVVLDKNRQYMRSLSRETVYDESTCLKQSLDSDLLELKELLSCFTEEERKVIHLRVMGYTYEEIGKMLGKHTSVVAYRLNQIQCKTVEFYKKYEKLIE